MKGTVEITDDVILKYQRPMRIPVSSFTGLTVDWEGVLLNEMLDTLVVALETKMSFHV